MKLALLWIGGMVLAVGVGLAGCSHDSEPARAASAGATPAGTPQAGDPLAQALTKDPAAVLQEGLARYDRAVTSYTCTLYRQERMNPNGPMGPEQKMACKFMDKPFSVLAETVENPTATKKVLYVEGKWDNKMLVQPSGLGVLLGMLFVDPRGPQARADSLQFIDQFGFKRSAEELIHACRAARAEGILTSNVVGSDTIGGRDAIVYDAKVAEAKPTGRFAYPHVRVWIDRQWLLPVAIDTWDASGIQRGHYRYVDVNFRANLTANDFLPEANGMKLPNAASANQTSGVK